MTNYTAFSILLFFSFLYFSATNPPINNNAVQSNCINAPKSCDCIKNEGVLYDLKNKLISNYIDFQSTRTEILSTVLELNTEINIQSNNNNISAEFLKIVQSLNNRTTQYLIDLQNTNVTSVIELQSLYDYFLSENVTLTTILQSIYQQAIETKFPMLTIQDISGNLTIMNNTIFDIKQQFDELILLNQAVLSDCARSCLDNTDKIQNLTNIGNLLKTSINTIIEYDNIAFEALALTINQLNQYLCDNRALCVTGTASNLGLYSSGTVTNVGISTVNGDFAYDISAVGAPLNVVSGSVYNPLPSQPGIDLSTFLNCEGLKGCNVNLGSGIAGTGPVTLKPGVYCNTQQPNELFTISTDIILDGLGMDNPSWKFNIEGTLVIAQSVQINIINTENPCNVVWIIGLNSVSPVSGNSLEMGISSKIDGSVIANYDVRLLFATTITGKLISYSNIYLDDSFINTQNCLGNSHTCSNSIIPLNIPSPL
jgi:hypothetical protein